MPGFNRRSKPLKGAVSLTDISNFSLANPADDDLIAYDLGTGLWVNTKSLTGDYTISGSLTVNNIVLSAGITAGSDIAATGDLDIGGNGEIDGTLVVGGALTADSLAVTASATIGTTLGVTGTLTGSAFSFSGNGTVGGTLGVTGAITATGGLVIGDLSPSGDLVVGGNAEIAGVLTAADDLNVLGNLSGTSISGTSLSTGGNLSVSGSIQGARFSIARTAPDIIWQNTTDDETVLFRGAYNAGAGQVETDMLKLTPNVGADFSGLIRIPGETGFGIQVGSTPTYPWHDLIGQIFVEIGGATAPPFEQILSTGFFAHNFDVNDEVWVKYHIPHDYVPGSDIYLHAHWMPDGTDTNDVVWEFEYAYAHGHDQAAFPLGSTTTVTATQTVGGTQYQHYVTETAAQTITMEADGILFVKVTRITNGGTDNSDEIYLLLADVHYQSTDVGTKNKSPNFYET